MERPEPKIALWTITNPGSGQHQETRQESWTTPTFSPGSPPEAWFPSLQSLSWVSRLIHKFPAPPVGMRSPWPWTVGWGVRAGGARRVPAGGAGGEGAGAGKLGGVGTV